MSNHDGGHLLNEFVNGLAEIGLFDGIDTDRKAKVADLLRTLKWDHDCNWGEIIDPGLAKLLGTCICCGMVGKADIDDDGYCGECSKHAESLER